MNRDLGNVPFSLKFKGADALTPKECCDGLETMSSCRGFGVVVVFYLFIYFVNETHKFSPHVTSKSACACNTGQEVLASVPGAQRLRAVYCSC